MDYTHPYGSSINILKFSESKEVIVDNRELEKIFNHPKIQDRKVVILSLIGAFRGGKSFFLNYCLRYLYAHYPSINNKSKASRSVFAKNDNWMGNADEPLKGFAWRSGSVRETIGIEIWNDVFLHTNDKSGEKIAIFVMDTQGLFDTDSTPTDNSRIFALGTMISSIQVLNLKQQIQEDQLQYLHFATGLTQFIAQKKGKIVGKPFQKLMFLIRDFEHFEEFEFGSNGGKAYLDNIIRNNKSNKSELKSVREFIKNSFEQLECCLMPYPGSKLVGRKSYDGNWLEMDNEFKNELKNAIEHLLIPQNLTLKEINSKNLTCKEMKTYIIQYLTLYQSNEIPDIPTLHQSMLQNSMNMLIENCVAEYKSKIENDTDLKTERDIPIIHKKWKSIVMLIYDGEDKMGDKQQQDEFKVQLDKKIEGIYVQFKSFHEKKYKELKIQEESHRVRLNQEIWNKQQEEQKRRKAEVKLIEISFQKAHIENKLDQLNLTHQKIKEDNKETKKELAEATQKIQDQQKKELAIQAKLDNEKLKQKNREMELKKNQDIKRKKEEKIKAKEVKDRDELQEIIDKCFDEHVKLVGSLFDNDWAENHSRIRKEESSKLFCEQTKDKNYEESIKQEYKKRLEGRIDKYEEEVEVKKIKAKEVKDRNELQKIIDKCFDEYVKIVGNFTMSHNEYAEMDSRYGKRQSLNLFSEQTKGKNYEDSIEQEYEKKLEGRIDKYYEEKKPNRGAFANGLVKILNYAMEGTNADTIL